MTNYDDLFEAATTEDSVFADKSALDPLADPEEVVAREDQQAAIAELLTGVHEGYLPTTVSVYGPPGTGKTLTTRRVCTAFAERTEDVAVEYVNLKECRSLFSVANEILVELGGERQGAYEGLDGVFEAIWRALDDYPKWTILILDEIDHIQHDTNYDPSDFFYRLLRGEGRQQSNTEVSAWLISNELLEVDLRLDSRIRSAMSGEEIFFPPYGINELETVVAPRLAAAFREDALPTAVRDLGIEQAARRWGDARKTLTLFRHAGETANERGLDAVTEDCIMANLETTDETAVQQKLLGLPFNHFFVLSSVAITQQASTDADGAVTTSDIADFVRNDDIAEDLHLSDQMIRELVSDLETMNLVETWIDARGREGRVKQIKTQFDPAWVTDVIEQYVDQSDQVTRDDIFVDEAP